VAVFFGYQLPSSKPKPNGSNQKLGEPYGQKGKENIAQKMPALSNSHSANQRTSGNTDHKPKSLTPSGTKHTQ
jgi:hypothetical protein